MRPVSSLKVVLRVLAPVLGLAAMAILGPPSASAGEFVLENNSNETVHVAVGYVRPDGRNIDEGWYTIPPGQSRPVYRGSNDRIAIHMQTGPDRHELRPHRFSGTVNRYTCHQRFVRENTDTPGNIKLTWGPNLERSYFKDQNDRLPPGWYDTRYYVVSANERFTVVP
jgi:uncharacterized membrane protein